MKKNKYSTPLWVLATILAGMLSPMQSAVNGQLGHWLQDGNACAVISFASGLVVMFFIIMARKEIRQQFAAIPSLIKNRKVPLWNWFAGLCGAMVVFSEGASASALGVATFQTALNRPGFPGECFICELRLPDHRFRWKHNKLFLLLPVGYGPAFPAIVDCYTSPPT
ncbi:hypothetical protein AC16_4584 [Escherichia coli 2-177-06_S3_C2]|nr:hypothetical protein AC16_4584 [Escherichia coli 2-177-06_S3_C2]